MLDEAVRIRLTASCPDVDSFAKVVHLRLCDAQGGETELMSALAPVVDAGDLGFLIVSTHAEVISGDPLTHRRCLAAIEAMGGHILVEHDVHKPLSGDGLVAARFGPVPKRWRTPPISRNHYSTSLFRNPLHALADARRDGDRTRDAATVGLLYRHLLGREADEEGLAYHVDLVRGAPDVGAAITALVDSAEFRARSRQLAAPATNDTLRALLAAGDAPPVRIVDIGAQRLVDQRHAYAPLADAGFAIDVIGFEPLPDRLTDRAQAGESGALEMLPHVVGDGSMQTFHANGYDATSSLLPFNEAVTASFVELRDLHTLATHSMKTRRLDDILTTSGHVDILKIDIQGGELAAVSHAITLLERTGVVHCEVLFADVYRGQGYFADIDRLLRTLGFVLIDVLNNPRGGYVVPSAQVSGDRRSGRTRFISDRSLARWMPRTGVHRQRSRFSSTKRPVSPNGYSAGCQSRHEGSLAGEQRDNAGRPAGDARRRRHVTLATGSTVASVIAIGGLFCDTRDATLPHPTDRRASGSPDFSPYCPIYSVYR